MQRRTLLQWLAGAAASTAAGVSIPSVARAAEAALSGRRIERIGIQLYTVRALLERNFDDTLRALGAAGYREVEFAGWYGRTPAQLREALRGARLTAPSAHVDVAELRRDAAGVMGAHAEAGFRYVIVPWLNVDDRRTLDDWRRRADEFTAFAEVARRAGVTFAYHNHEFEFTPIDGVLPMEVLATRTDPVLVKLELDLYWTVAAGASPVKWITRWPGRVVAVHVKDRSADGTMVDVGQGTIPFGELLRVARANGLRHWFVEHDNPADPMASAIESHNWLAKLKL
ncbi:MAG: sugar phosphate isomerase/epimerase [Gemmatimonadaceae bacterium]|nr:sugar phosphate isomerase/epimerase [Gemmatimonadaceae bacterium]